jgi:flagellar biosynthesis GTPase FlhF
MEQTRRQYYFIANFFVGINFLVNFITIVLLANNRIFFGGGDYMNELFSRITIVYSVPANIVILFVILFFLFKLFTTPMIIVRENNRQQTETPESIQNIGNQNQQSKTGKLKRKKQKNKRTAKINNNNNSETEDQREDKQEEDDKQKETEDEEKEDEERKDKQREREQQKEQKDKQDEEPVYFV